MNSSILEKSKNLFSIFGHCVYSSTFCMTETPMVAQCVGRQIIIIRLIRSSSHHHAFLYLLIYIVCYIIYIDIYIWRTLNMATKYWRKYWQKQTIFSNFIQSKKVPFPTKELNERCWSLDSWRNCFRWIYHARPPRGHSMKHLSSRKMTMSVTGAC